MRGVKPYLWARRLIRGVYGNNHVMKTIDIISLGAAAFFPPP
jgi:hypothetical protein